jgi:hypothetical protein
MTRYDYENYFKDIIDKEYEDSCIKYPIIDRENKLKNNPKINTTLSTENNNDDDDGGYKKIPRNIVVEYECKLKQPIDNIIGL